MSVSHINRAFKWGCTIAPAHALTHPEGFRCVIYSVPKSTWAWNSREMA